MDLELDIWSHYHVTSTVVVVNICDRCFVTSTLIGAEDSRVQTDQNGS